VCGSARLEPQSINKDESWWEMQFQLALDHQVNSHRLSGTFINFEYKAQILMRVFATRVVISIQLSSTLVQLLFSLVRARVLRKLLFSLVRARVLRKLLFSLVRARVLRKLLFSLVRAWVLRNSCSLWSGHESCENSRANSCWPTLSSNRKKERKKKRGSVNLFYLIENSIEFQYYSLLNKIGSHSPSFFSFLFSYYYYSHLRLTRVLRKRNNVWWEGAWQSQQT
jgi:hypothetical protein